MLHYLLGFFPAHPDPALAGVIIGLCVPALIYGPLFVLMFAMRKVARAGSYERRGALSRKSYRPPLAYAFGAVAFVLFYPALLAATLPDSVFAPLLQRWVAPGHPGLGRDLLLAACAAGLACWGATSWLRRCTLTLNLQERTYRSVDLSSLSLRAQSGSWRDIAGVHVYSNNRRRPKESFVYYVGLQLPGGRKVYSVLGGFRRQEQAEAFAAKAAGEMGLPLLRDAVRQVEKGRSGRGY